MFRTLRTVNCVVSHFRAPHMHAICLEALDIQPGQAFLDVGSGCGHVTALGGYLVGPVLLVEL